MERVTIGILTYNHQKFIEKCLESVLALKYENLEIVISDDCSTDKTREVIENFLSNVETHHTVLFNKNETNLGLASHFNKVFGELATGNFLITLGGDDMIKEDYLEMAVSYFEKDASLMMLDFNADIIDENGKVTQNAKDLGYDFKSFELHDYLALEPIPSFAPGRMIRKDLVQKYDPISKSCPTEDSVLVLRALMMGKLGRLNKDVILYRRHTNNISSSDNLRKLSNASIIAQYLKDTVFLYHQNQIPEKSIGKLFDRINFEFHKRELSYGNTKTIKQRLKFRLRRFLYLNNI